MKPKIAIACQGGGSQRNEAIKIEHILASACVPNLFPSVTIEDMAYWDGLFSDNPPIRSLIRRDFVGVENIPNELWIIKINPTFTDKIKKNKEKKF